MELLLNEKFRVCRCLKRDDENGREVLMEICGQRLLLSLFGRRC